MNSELDLLIVGYGRFGRALLGLARDAGLRCGAIDELADPAAEDHATPEQVATARFVALATPVPSIGQCAASLIGRIAHDAVVFDVGSVKVRPTEALERELGDRFAWVPTHPLFGPASLARGERPLRVVVCSNDTPHRDAAARVVAFYKSIGCEVIELGAHEHDRKMARTHALAFFVARGVLDIGVDIDEPLAPPSFKAMATTVRTVREDAGHLFDVLHGQNPYASGMRKEYLQALSALDDGLPDEE